MILLDNLLLLHESGPLVDQQYDSHIFFRDGYDEVESQGLPSHVADEVVVTRFNDAERLNDDFRRYGDRVACFIVEPIVGAGGFVPATGEYREFGVTH